MKTSRRGLPLPARHPPRCLQPARSPPARRLRARILPVAAAGLAAVASLAGCAEGRSRPYESRVASALPEQDPASRGTVAGSWRPISEYEQVMVRLGRDAEGKVVVLQVLSPVLTPEQQEELRRAFAVGGWKRELPVDRASESWIESLVRAR